MNTSNRAKCPSAKRRDSERVRQHARASDRAAARRERKRYRTSGDRVAKPIAGFGSMATGAASNGAAWTFSGIAGAKGSLVILGVAGVAGYLLYSHPPMQRVGRGEIGVRVNQVTEPPRHGAGWKPDEHSPPRRPHARAG